VTARARSHLGVLVRYDLRYSLSSPRGLLFLVFFGIVWGWIFTKLAGGAAERIEGSGASMVLAWFLDEGVMRLLSERPPTLSAYFAIAMTLTPIFALIGAADQTATDLGTKHLRFLIPRVGRGDIFLARAIGASLLVIVGQLLAGIAATIITLVVHEGDAGTTVLYGLAVTAILCVYSLPFVALMSLVSAGMASVGLSLLVGVGGYLLLAVVLSFVLPSEGWPRYFAYVLPNGLKRHILQPAIGQLLAGVGAAVAYVALFAVLGWRVFKVRDA
jgi:hypothetical protein